MEKLRMQSANGVEDNIQKIAQLFPDCVTETVDENSGQPKHLIDFEKLKQNLSDSIISEKAERYQFTWPDKSKAILLANSPINATLRPCREESVDFDHTQNLYIEGDNLDVLKCLKETYLHKVKMIYIDPPYNTGNDFVYEDDFAQSSEEYLANSGQYDEQGNRMFTNAESNGRFHTDWLNMIYPRLKVARDLLTDDGVIFISIDDNEVENLRKVCDEVFGESNFVTQFVWEKKKKPSFLNINVGTKTEYILCYAKNRPQLGALSVDTTEEGKKYPINNAGNSLATLTFPIGSVSFNMPDGLIESQDMSGGNIKTELLNDFHIENGTNKEEFQLRGEWRYSQTTLNEILANGDKIVISKIPFRPNHIKTGGEIKKMHNLLSNALYPSVGSNEDATSEIISILGTNCFDYSKPSSLIRTFIKACTYDQKESFILDFFSGSASTAHAVMQMNAEDGGNRKFIMVQLPENIDKILETANDKAKKTAKNAINFLDSIGKPHTICEIGKERIRRAGKKIKEESPLTTQDLDTGFRVLKLDSTNMENIYYSPKDISQADLFTQVDNVKSDRTGEDLLFQVMLELGATLDSKIESTTVDGKTIYNVAEGYLVACFDMDVTDEVVTAIAKMQPAYAVLRDTSMKNDATATNFEQIFKTYSPDTVTRIL